MPEPILRDEKFNDPKKRNNLIGQKANQLKRDFNTLFPEIPFTPQFNRTVTFSSTKDGLPFIGTYKRLPNSYFSLGFGGNGITFSLIGAEVITDLMPGKEDSDAALFHLSLVYRNKKIIRDQKN